MSTSRASVPEITRPSLPGFRRQKPTISLELFLPKTHGKGSARSGSAPVESQVSCLPHVESPWHGCKNRDERHRLISKCASYFRGLTVFSIITYLAASGLSCRVLLHHVGSFIAAHGFSSCGTGAQWLQPAGLSTH